MQSFHLFFHLITSHDDYLKTHRENQTPIIPIEIKDFYIRWYMRLKFYENLR